MPLPGNNDPVPSRTGLAVYLGDTYTIVLPLADIHIDTCQPLQRWLAALTAWMLRPRIVLQLTRVAVCDSTALHVMVHAHRAATAGGGWLRLVEVQPLVSRVLHLTGLAGVLPVYATIADAIADVPAGR